MTLANLSTEQQDLVRLALAGRNILCDACIGSGKTSTINVLCNEFDASKQILYLTYNRLLKLDAQEKILNDNVTVQNYHGYASKLLYRHGIRNIGQGEQIKKALDLHVPVGRYDVLIIDEYQDINEEISRLLEYIKEENPTMQIIAVGDMAQKIYDTTSLDIWKFIHGFLGAHTQVNFTQCFRLSHNLAERLGTIWNKEINGVNENCEVKSMTKDEVIEYLNDLDPKNVLCLGARTGQMAAVLNALEERLDNLYDKKHVYASIKDNDGEKSVAPNSNVGIFTTFDGSKGMERPICVVFDFTEDYWATRMRQPLTRYEIMRNLFCVAASRGKQEVIFVKPDKRSLVSDKTLMTPVKTRTTFKDKFDISEMFDFKFDEDVDACYNLITAKQVFQQDQTEIEIKHSDAMIDLSPCIGIYQQANFFDFYDIDSAIAFFMYLHKDKMAKVPTTWKSVEQKVLFLTMLMTSQDRYIKQVELPFITPEQAKALTDRLSTMFTHDEEVQERAELKLVVEQDELKQPVTSLIVSGMADVVKDNKVYCLKFVSNLAHKHFIQCACYMLATGLPTGVLWNIRDNTMYEVEIPDRTAFLNAVVKCITKGVYTEALSYNLEKDYSQSLDTILDRVMSDTSLPEFDTGGNIVEETPQDEGVAIIKQGEQYVILDAGTRSIVDGTAVNGYDTILAACEAYVKQNKKATEESVNKKELLHIIEQWLDDHAEFEHQMSCVAVDIENHVGPYSGYSTFSTYVVRKMLKDCGLVIDFNERQLLKVWKVREKKRPKPVTQYSTAQAPKQVVLNPADSFEQMLNSLQSMGVDVKVAEETATEPYDFSQYKRLPPERKTYDSEPVGWWKDGEEQYKKEKEALPADYRVIRSSKLSKPGDVRYVIMEEDSNTVLDDANGYGYKSVQAAHKGYGYKRRNGGSFGSKKKEKSEAKPQTTGEQLSFGGL